MKKSKIIGLATGITVLGAAAITVPFVLTSCSNIVALLPKDFITLKTASTPEGASVEQIKGTNNFYVYTGASSGEVFRNLNIIDAKLTEVFKVDQLKALGFLQDPKPSKPEENKPEENKPEENKPDGNGTQQGPNNQKESNEQGGSQNPDEPQPTPPAQNNNVIKYSASVSLTEKQLKDLNADFKSKKINVFELPCNLKIQELKKGSKATENNPNLVKELLIPFTIRFIAGSK